MNATWVEFPVLRRELLGLLRTRRAFWLLVLAVALSSLIALANWPDAANTAAGGGNQNSKVIAAFLLAQLASVLIVVPVLTAGAIAGERERGTWDLLLATHLSPASILVSKTFASFGYLLVLLVASAPSFYSLHLLGGASFGTIVHCYLTTLAAGCMATIVSLVESLRSERTAQATVRGVAMVLVWSLQPMPMLFCMFGYLVLLLARKTPKFLYPTYSRTSPVWTLFAATIVAGAFLALCSLLIAVMSVVVQVFRPSTGSLGIGPFTVISSEVLGTTTHEATILYALFAALVSAGHALYLFRNVLRAEAIRRPRDPRPQPPRRLMRRGPARAARARPKARSLLTRMASSRGDTGSPVLGNAIFLKEIRTEFHGGSTYARATFWGPLPLFVLTMLATGETRFGAVRGAFFVASIICLIIVPAVTGTSITRESEQGNLDFLRGTILSSGEILRGKLLASLHACVGVVAALAGALIIALAGLLLSMIVSTPKLPDLVGALFLLITSALVLLILIAFSATAGLLSSVVARHTTPALLLAYGLGLVPAGLWLFATRIEATEELGGILFVVCMGAAALLFWLLACWWFARFRMRES